MLDQFQSLLPYITRRLITHHQLYPLIKVKGSYWEFILYDSLNEGYPESEPHWDYGSQKIGRDITLNNGIGISCKSGQIHPDGRIKISSSSLSRLSDLEKIKDYLRTAKTEDYIACLSTKGKQQSKGSQQQYLYSIYDVNVFDYENVDWEYFGEDNDLKGRHASGVMTTCTKKMGYQVWYHLPIDLALYAVEITPTGVALPMDLPVYRRPTRLTADHLFSFV